MLARLLLVGLGGGAGSVLRYLLGVALAGSRAGAPLATWTVNVVGSFALGAVASGWSEPSLARLAFATGVLGGFTTYSAFNQEALDLLREGRGGVAAAYVALTLAGALAAGAAGVAVGSRLAR